MATPNLAVGYVASNQSQKEVTINAGLDALDNASNRSLTVDCTTPVVGVVAITVSQYTRNAAFLLTGAPGSSFVLTVPDTARIFLVSNSSGQTAAVSSAAGGTTTNLPTGYTGMFVNVGSDAMPAAAFESGSGGGGSISTDSDVVLASQSDDDLLVWDASVSRWKNRRPRYIVGASALTGTLTASQVLLYHKFSKGVTFPANFGAYLGHTSEAGGDAAAAGSTVVTVDRATAGSPLSFSNIGSITIGAGTVTATLATVGGTSVAFAQGDVLRLRGPVVADASFSNFFATLVGFET
jgi:hypothetical protein